MYMLLELNIENFILIENINIAFTKGLNVMSGETGAGKSIVIDAVNLVLGEKSNKEYVRTGKEKAVIQAVFDISSIDIKTLLDEYGIDCEDNILIFTREIYGTGRSLGRINGRLVQLSLMKKIGKMLIDIHGQHEHQSLLYSENHLNMLDLYGNEELKGTLHKVKERYKKIKNIQNELKTLKGNDKEREREIDLLKFQIEEIDTCNLKSNEDVELDKEYKLLKNSEAIYSTISSIYEMVSPNMNENITISGLFSNILGDFEIVASLDEKLLNFFNELQDIHYRLQDISTDLRHYRENITFDPDMLLEIENRLDTINNLKRKYGNTIEEIFNYRRDLSEKLETLINSTDKINKLNADLKKLKEEYLNFSNELSTNRKRIGKEFERKILQELKYLNLDKAKFKVNIEQNLDKDSNIILAKDGLDKIEFLISTNPGEPLKPLSKVASGGEISRIMLAMKVILAKIDNIPTLIFDEIDTGISGKTANVVGEKLFQISDTHQTICISHLPQICVMGDNHLFIEKTLLNDQTITSIKTLGLNERINEISRLIGGNVITDLTEKNAKEMLELAEKTKKRR